MDSRAFVIVLLAIACAGSAVGEDLEGLFVRAARERAAVVPLIVEGSRVIATLKTDEAIPLAERLFPFCRQALFSPMGFPGAERIGVVGHVVVHGETPSGVARRFGIGAGLLGVLNPGSFREGRELKVLDGSAPLTLVVSRSRFRMFAWRSGILLAVLPVSVGKPGHETPLGRTTIASRVRDPEWRDPDTGAIYAPHDPRNVLGGFWLGFDPLPTRAFRGIGLHGFTAERADAWLGTASSHGCVRLAQPDIAVVFDLALPGTTVVIRE